MVAATPEVARSVNPATALLIEKKLSPLLVHPQTLPTTGFLAYVIPGLDVDLEHFVGVWEGETEVGRVSGGLQPAIVRIELGRTVSEYHIESSIEIVGLVDRGRERWTIKEMSSNDSSYRAYMELKMGFVGGMSSGQLGEEFTLDCEKYGLSLAFSEPFLSMKDVKKPSQLPLHTTNNTSYGFTRISHTADKAGLILLDLRDTILRAGSGIAAPEIRSRVTERTPKSLVSIH